MRLVKFFLILVLLLVICTVCYWNAFAMSENDSGQGFIINVLANYLFPIFCFPFVVLSNWIGFENEWAFYGGLFLDCILYALISEMIFERIRQRRIRKTISV